MRIRSGVCLLAIGILLGLPFATAQTPTLKGRIEGVVLQGGGASPQPVAGARVGVVKVSGTTGQNLIVPGRKVGASITGGDSTPFPGMPVRGSAGGPGPAGPPPPPPGPMALRFRLSRRSRTDGSSFRTSTKDPTASVCSRMAM